MISSWFTDENLPTPEENQQWIYIYIYRDIQTMIPWILAYNKFISKFIHYNHHIKHWKSEMSYIYP